MAVAKRAETTTAALLAAPAALPPAPGVGLGLFPAPPVDVGPTTTPVEVPFVTGAVEVGGTTEGVAVTEGFAVELGTPVVTVPFPGNCPSTQF